MRVRGKVKYNEPGKCEGSKTKEFANQYIKNVIENQIKVVCPQCNMNTTIYPEHLDRAYCERCNILLEVVDKV